MKYTEKLVALMEDKRAKIIEAIGAEFGDLYFTEEDAKELRSLPENEAREIYAEIEMEIFDEADGLNEELCPFCYIASCCNKCGYAGRHGECKERRSDFDQIVSRVLETNNSFFELFSNDFYRKLIKK